MFQEHGKILSERAVAYLNIDIAIERNYTIRGEGVPLIEEAIYTVAKKVNIGNCVRLIEITRKPSGSWHS